MAGWWGEDDPYRALANQIGVGGMYRTGRALYNNPREFANWVNFANQANREANVIPYAWRAMRRGLGELLDPKNPFSFPHNQASTAAMDAARRSGLIPRQLTTPPRLEGKRPPPGGNRLGIGLLPRALFRARRGIDYRRELQCAALVVILVLLLGIPNVYRPRAGARNFGGRAARIPRRVRPRLDEYPALADRLPPRFRPVGTSRSRAV